MGVLNSGLPQKPTSAIRKVTALLKEFPVALPSMTTSAAAMQCLQNISTLVANQWQTTFQISGKGQINWAGIYDGSGSGTKTMNIRVTIDGNQFTLSKSVTSANPAVPLIGTSYALASGDVLATPQPIMFDSLFSIELMTPPGAGNVYTYYNAEVHA